MNQDQEKEEKSKNKNNEDSKKEVDQELDPQPGSSKKTENRYMMRSFDRLVPRYCDEQRKRKSTSAASTSEQPQKKPQQQQANDNKGAKKEYSKLRTLVPALNEREDLSKVEIIEETIRYIDALHHQLAARGLNPSQEESERTAPPASESNPESSASPLKALLGAEGSRPPRRNVPSSSTTDGASGSSSDRSSTHDVKAAVENIQAMFAAYLEHQRHSSSSSDESTS